MATVARALASSTRTRGRVARKAREETGETELINESVDCRHGSRRGWFRSLT